MSGKKIDLSGMTPEQRANKFTEEVKSLLDAYGMKTTVLGVAFTEGPEDKGFTSFAAIIREEGYETNRALVMLDAIRADIISVYRDVGRQSIAELAERGLPKDGVVAIPVTVDGESGPEGMKSLLAVLEGVADGIEAAAAAKLAAKHKGYIH